MQEKTFNDFLSEAQEVPTETIEETVEETADSEEEEVDIETEIEDEEVAEVEETDDTEVEEITEVEEKPDFKAFADMRTKNKQLAEAKEKAESELQKAQALAIKLGFENTDEMLAEATKREIAEEAKKEGIPVEYLERMRKLEEKDRQRDLQIEAEAKERKEVSLLSNIDSFITEKKLSEKDYTNVFTALEEDGFAYETLLELPEKSVSKLLNSYVNKEVSKQDELAKKAKVIKEIPMTPTEKNDGEVKTIEDDLFLIMSGQKTEF